MWGCYSGPPDVSAARPAGAIDGGAHRHCQQTQLLLLVELEGDELVRAPLDLLAADLARVLAS